MCRLSAITSSDYISPMENIHALETMKEGHDGSGLGLMLKDMGGPFEDFKQYPTLSAICSGKGLAMLEEYMKAQGFTEKFSWEPPIKNMPGIERREHYIAKVYDYPAAYKDKPKKEQEDLLMQTRLALRMHGRARRIALRLLLLPRCADLKEVGDPLEVGEFFGIEKSGIKSKIVLAQGRQNTNYAIYLYACHPFFIQGYATMTNGENTAFVPIREFLTGRGNPGYMGYNSDSEVFTHIMHYTNRTLGYPLPYYKDVITPMKDAEIAEALRRAARSGCSRSRSGRSASTAPTASSGSRPTARSSWCRTRRSSARPPWAASPASTRSCPRCAAWTARSRTGTRQRIFSP